MLYRIIKVSQVQSACAPSRLHPQWHLQRCSYIAEPTKPWVQQLELREQADWRDKGWCSRMGPVPLPEFHAPDFLRPTGELEKDLFPILSMVACLPTLHMFWTRKRYADVFAYGLGFILAVIYHAMYFSAIGSSLDQAVFLGLTGTAWRTLDILSANVCLARTMGHALGADHPLIALIPNFGLPLALVALLVFFPKCDIGVCTKVTCAFMALTLIVQMVARGRAVAQHVARRYTRSGLLRAMLSIGAGLFSFAMPQLQPQAYWLWHSLWHVFMGLGYFELYAQLEGLRHVEEAAAAVKGAAGEAQFQYAEYRRTHSDDDLQAPGEGAGVPASPSKRAIAGLGSMTLKVLSPLVKGLLALNGSSNSNTSQQEQEHQQHQHGGVIAHITAKPLKSRLAPHITAAGPQMNSSAIAADSPMAQGSVMTLDRQPFSGGLGLGNGTAGIAQYIGEGEGEQAGQGAGVTQRGRRSAAAASTKAVAGMGTTITTATTPTTTTRGRTPRRRRPVTQADVVSNGVGVVLVDTMGSEPGVTSDQAVHTSKTPSRRRGTSGSTGAAAKAVSTKGTAKAATGGTRSGRSRSKSRARAD